MNKPMVAISLLLPMLFVLGCDFGRVSPVECIRFKTSEAATLSRMADILLEKELGLTASDYSESFTERQSKAGEKWIVLRRQSIEISMRSHDVGLSDICVYNHGEQSKNDQLARRLLAVIKDFLTEQGVKFSRQ